MEHIESFYQYQLKLGYHPKSTKYQYSILLSFLAWLENQDKTLSQVDQSTLQSYYQYLQTRPQRRVNKLLSSKTIYTHIKTLESFYTYLNQRGQLNRNPFASFTIHYPKVETRSRLILSNQEIKTLYQVAENYQERAILSLAYGAGLRAKEIEQVNLLDILFNEKLLVIPQGKGHKRRLVPLSLVVISDLQNYLHYERQATKEKAFLLNARGTRLKAWTLNKRLKELINRTGKASLQVKVISLHNLRHSIASHLLEQGLSVEQVRLFLGHARLETTQIYIRVHRQQLNQLIAP